MSILLGLTILDAGVPFSMVCAVIGLVFALSLIAIVSRSSSGNKLAMKAFIEAVSAGRRSLSRIRTSNSAPGVWSSTSRQFCS